jgi:hypothetical protein
MKLSDRLIQLLTVRSLGGSGGCGRRPNSSALPAAPLGVSPALRYPCKTALTPALLLQRLPPGPELPVESP